MVIISRLDVGTFTDWVTILHPGPAVCLLLQYPSDEETKKQQQANQNQNQTSFNPIVKEFTKTFVILKSCHVIFMAKNAELVWKAHHSIKHKSAHYSNRDDHI